MGGLLLLFESVDFGIVVDIGVSANTTRRYYFSAGHPLQTLFQYEYVVATFGED
jgi:hypothetical protein